MRVTVMRSKKKIAAVAIAASLAVVVALLVMVLSIESLLSQYAAPTYPGKAAVSLQELRSSSLFYNMGVSIVPYILLRYSAKNTSYIIVNVSVYQNPPPSSIYILNTSGGLCTRCSNVTAVESYLPQALQSFGVSGQVGKVNISQLSSIEDAILIVPTGRLPYQMLNSTNGTTVLDELLSRGVSVVYVGLDFSQICALGTCSVLTTPQTVEPYLATAPPARGSPSSGMRAFSFGQQEFAFSKGAEFGNLTYVNAFGGSIVSFANYPDSWPAKSEAYDLAKAVSEMFWLPVIAQGAALVNVNGSADGNIGILASKVPLNQSRGAPGSLGDVYIRAIAYNNPGYLAANNSVYSYLSYGVSYAPTGTLSLPEDVLPVYNTDINGTLPLTGNISVSFAINNAADFRLVKTLPLIQFKSVTAGQPFISAKRISLPPGYYILSMVNLLNYTYASALFRVPPVNITPTAVDFAANNYTFTLSMDGVPLSGLNYSVALSTCGICPPFSGTVQPDGRVFYTLRGAQQGVFFGAVNFTFSILGAKIAYSLQNNPTKITISGPEVELAVTVIIMLVLVLAVKAPNRDEFYIDVPIMPKPSTVEVRLKPDEVLSVFDKLNMYYHWQYMPLSVDEVKNAIKMNVRAGNMPVTVTYNNAEAILNELHIRGDVVSCDNLFAPKGWVDLSGHDIEYLAAFKKLRVWLVTHSYMFTDINASDAADTVITSRGERAYIIIYSQTSRFKAVPVAADSQTYLAFINSEKLMGFKDVLADAKGDEAELLRMYIATGRIKLMDAESIGQAFAA